MMKDSLLRIGSLACNLILINSSDDSNILQDMVVSFAPVVTIEVISSPLVSCTMQWEKCIGLYTNERDK